MSQYNIRIDCDPLAWLNLPGSASYRQEMCNGVPEFGKLAEYSCVAAEEKYVAYSKITGQSHGGAWLWDHRTPAIAGEFCRRYII